MAIWLMGWRQDLHWTAGLISYTSKEISPQITVPVPDLIALLFVCASVVNVYAVRHGTVPDLMLLGVAVVAFVWTISKGLNAKKIMLYLLTIGMLFSLYVLLSAYHLSYGGFRNAASIFAVTAIFLFFFGSSRYLQTSPVFLAALCIGFAFFIFLRELPLDVSRNLVNSAMCYWVISIFLCLTRLKSIALWNVSILFTIIFVLSLVNDHRTLAGLSVILLFQFIVLNLNIARKPMRALMFVGMVLCGVGVIALLVHPDLIVFANAFNDLLLSEGERRIMSGRELIWPAIWEAILLNPILGLGPGASTGDLYATNLSAHNFYLEIGMQLGLVGIVLVVVLFWSLWRVAKPSGRPELCAAENFLTVLITMVALHCLFDVFLTQDSLAVGIPVWMALGLGLGGLAREVAMPSPSLRSRRGPRGAGYKFLSQSIHSVRS